MSISKQIFFATKALRHEKISHRLFFYHEGHEEHERKQKGWFFFRNFLTS